MTQHSIEEIREAVAYTTDMCPTFAHGDTELERQVGIIDAAIDRLESLDVQVVKMQAVIDAAEKLAEVVMLHKPRITCGEIDTQMRGLLAALDVYAPTEAQEGDIDDC